MLNNPQVALEFNVKPAIANTDSARQHSKAKGQRLKQWAGHAIGEVLTRKALVIILNLNNASAVREH